MRFTIYPWKLKAWRESFQVAGMPGFALFALLLGAIFQVADSTQGGGGHGNKLVILLVRAPLALAALLIVLYKPRFARVSLTDARFVFFLFAFLFTASTIWSAHRVITLGKSLEIGLVCLVFLQVSRTGNPLERVEALRHIILLTIAAVAFVTVLGYLAHIQAFVQQRPGIFTKTTAQAPFLSGNGLGYVASALFLVVLAEWQAKRIRRNSAFLQMAFAMFIFAFAASRTSFGILVLSVLLVILRKSKIAALLSFAAIALVIAMSWQTVVTHLQGNESTGSFETLSGRTVVWTAALRQWKTSPILGAGGGVGGKVVVENVGDQYLEQMSSVHDGFLELLTGLGAVGFVLGLYLLISVTWKAWTNWRYHPEYSGTYVLIVHVWLTTLMSTGALGWMGYEMALFLCIVTNVDLLRRHKARVAARAVYAPIPDAELVPQLTMAMK